MDAPRISAVAAVRRRARGRRPRRRAVAATVVGPAEVSFRTVRVGNDTEAVGRRSRSRTASRSPRRASRAATGSRSSTTPAPARRRRAGAGARALRADVDRPGAGDVARRRRDRPAERRGVRGRAEPRGVAEPLGGPRGQMRTLGRRAFAAFGVINRGDEPIRVTQARRSRDATPALFSLVSSECSGRRLAPGERCEIAGPAAIRPEARAAPSSGSRPSCRRRRTCVDCAPVAALRSGPAAADVPVRDQP